MSTTQRQRDKKLIQELRDRLNAWDPIGVRPPPDEYDCLHGPILRALREQVSVDDLAALLHRELVDHLGLSDATGESPVAAQLVAWYAESRPSN